MENVIADRVKNTRLTKSQRKIAEFFIQHPERVGMSSSMEMARAIGVSDASITRFARAIGYEGFTDLKNDIYSSLASQAAGGINNLSLAERFEANRTQFGGDSPAEYIGVIQYNLERTFRQNGEQQFQDAAELLRNAEHRYIIGFRGCLGVASQCAWLLRFLLDELSVFLAVYQRKGDILRNCHVGIKGIILKNKADSSFFRRKLCHIPVSEKDPSGGGF